jgi:hypothetical protein
MGFNSINKGNGDNDQNKDDDASLIRHADELFAEERLLAAARALRQVRDTSLLEAKHRSILKFAAAMEAGIQNLLESPEVSAVADGSTTKSVWKKQAERHGHRDFFVYYQVDDNNQLTSRIDCAIESSLLLPLISVFNESALFNTWMPSFQRPFKLGVQESNQLKETGRGNQIIQVTVGMAFPLKTRETVQHAVAADLIEEESAIAVQVLSETTADDPVIPEPRPGMVRIDFEGTFLFRHCPNDHPCLAKSKHDYPPDEPLVLISLSLKVDSKVKFVPLAMINFVTRTVLASMWTALLTVAEEVRDGKRPLHQEAIQQQQELYDWINARVKVMLEKGDTATRAKSEDSH